MRVASVSVIKGRRRSKNQTEPSEGSFIRTVYDTLQENKGIAVKLEVGNYSRATLCAAIGQLQDFYGLDIRWFQGKYVLVGEWVGMTYVDYTTIALDQRILKREAKERKHARRDT